MKSDKVDIERLVNVYKTPTLFLSRHEIVNAYRKLEQAMPGVRFYYALKSNNHQEIVLQLSKLGCGFDVCSNKEIDILEEHNIAFKNCIHTHPIKTEKDLTYAYKKGIKTFVVDNIEELHKLKHYPKDIRLLIRLATSNNSSVVNLSRKFGCNTVEELLYLIRKAWQFDIHDLGICFHTGSQNSDPKVFKHALETCIKVIKKLYTQNINISVIDIGGGFPVSYTGQELDFGAYCDVFYKHVEELIDLGVDVIAEPGRFISGNAMFLTVSIIGKAKRQNTMWYYVDDNIYNSLSGLIFDHIDYPFEVIRESCSKEIYNSVISGNTCDSFDIIKENINVRELDIGEVLAFKKIGAYSTVSASEFNGFPKTKVVVID